MGTVIVINKKQWSVGLICVALLLALPFAVGGFLGEAAVETGGGAANWGLSFPQPGQSPTVDADPATLRENNAYYCGDPAEKTLYITFDAGFENGHTAAILDTLKKHNVSATFFLVEHYIRSQPDLVKRMVAEGHTVGNHTATHPDMAKIADKAAFQKELQTLEAAYKEVVGKDMCKLYRPPQGKYSPQNLQMANELGYATVFWSLAYVDWYVDAQPTRQEALDKLLPRTHNGAVVLLHSTSATNAAVLDELLTRWEEAGYTFSTLPQLCKIA